MLGVRHVAVLVAAAALVVSAPGAAGTRDVSTARIAENVRNLAALGPRVPGSGAERRGTELAAAALRESGFRVLRQQVPLPRGGVSHNAVGLGEGPIRFVVVAHVDTVRGSPGANDNASGVAALLEAARVLGPRPGTAFAVVGAEERAETGARVHLGSQRFVRGVSPAARRVAYGVALDMVGVGGALHVRGIEAQPNRSARLLLREARRLGVRATYLRDSGISDHADLTRAGLPAAWLQWREDACWHRPCDRAQRVDPRKVAVVVRIVVAAASRASSGP